MPNFPKKYFGNHVILRRLWEPTVKAITNKYEWICQMQQMQEEQLRKGNEQPGMPQRQENQFQRNETDESWITQGRNRQRRQQHSQSAEPSREPSQQRQQPQHRERENRNPAPLLGPPESPRRRPGIFAQQQQRGPPVEQGHFTEFILQDNPPKQYPIYLSSNRNVTGLPLAYDLITWNKKWVLIKPNISIPTLELVQPIHHPN